MKIGFIGLGKLGMPVAATMALGGHEVIGYDVDERLMSLEPRETIEAGPDGTGNFYDYLKNSNIMFGNMNAVVCNSDIVFFAVQTPHAPGYDGTTELKREKKNFDYSYLMRAVKQAAEIAGQKHEDTVFAIISTVLPGTIDKWIRNLVPDNVHVVYNPSFIAMGTTMQDYLYPEFILVGGDETVCSVVAHAHISAINGHGIKPDVPVCYMSVQSAELTKVAYNTFIGAKIAVANTLMEICHHFSHANIDDVSNALSMATRRVASGAYMKGGMGDGGACHPRDNVAMSWLAENLNLSWDIFQDVMMCRYRQAKWLAQMMLDEADKCDAAGVDVDLVIVGYAYKPETNLIDGSPALLVKDILEKAGNKVTTCDPIVEGTLSIKDIQNSVILIGCKHSMFQHYQFGPRCTVIDPFRYMPNDCAAKVIRVGKGVPEPRVHRLKVIDTIEMVDR